MLGSCKLRWLWVQGRAFETIYCIIEYDNSRLYFDSLIQIEPIGKRARGLSYSMYNNGDKVVHIYFLIKLYVNSL